MAKKKAKDNTVVNKPTPSNAGEDGVLKAQEDKTAALEKLQERNKLRNKRESGILDWRNKIANAKDKEREERNASFTNLVNPNAPQANTIIKTDEELTQRNASPRGLDVSLEEETTDVDDTEVEDTIDTTDEPEYITKIINGKKVTHTQEEWIDIATKVTDADAYMAEAARLRQEALNPPVPSKNEQEELEELSDVLEKGTKEERTEALKKLTNMVVDKTTKKATQEQIQIAAKSIHDTLLNEYKDIAEDQVAYAAAMALDQKLIAEGKIFNANDQLDDFKQRLAHVFSSIRTWKNNLAENSVSDERKKEKLRKKALIKNVTGVSSSGGSNEPVVLTEREANQQAVAAIFASRKWKTQG